MADIFDLGDLPVYIGDPEADPNRVALARRFANGWLMSATRLSSWPDPVPDDLWAWAIELAAIAFDNPAGVDSEAIDDHKVTYNRERRAEILTAAGAAYAGATGPLYSFPEPDWHWEVADATTTAD